MCVTHRLTCVLLTASHVCYSLPHIGKILTDTRGLAVLWPVPVPRGVAPPSLLPQQDVARVAVELDLGAAQEVEGRLAPMWRSRQCAAGRHWQAEDRKYNIIHITNNNGTY